MPETRMRPPVWQQFAIAEATGAHGRAEIGDSECDCDTCDRIHGYTARGLLHPDEVIRE